MLSLLTLFPVGALTMAQAIKDDRTAHAAANATAIAEARNVRHDFHVDNGAYDMKNNNKYEPGDGDQYGWFRIMTEPSNPAGLVPLQNYDGPSYPVFVDPIGSAIKANVRGDTIGGVRPGIPRTNLAFVETWPPGPPAPPPPKLTLTQAFRWFSLLDDITYADPATSPAYGVPVPNPYVERENRYTWAYMVRRPRFRDHAVVDISVAVFSARSQVVPMGEYVFHPVAFHTPDDAKLNPAINPNTVRLDYTMMGFPTKPDIRKGHWILDATVQKPVGNQFVPEPHGHFYRVVGVTDTVDERGKPSLLLELQAPPLASTELDPANPNVNRFGVLVFMENLVEVVHKGAGWQP
jgi:hypothetical protein